MMTRWLFARLSARTLKTALLRREPRLFAYHWFEPSIVLLFLGLTLGKR
jgi:hypothetical protein